MTDRPTSLNKVAVIVIRFIFVWVCGHQVVLAKNSDQDNPVVIIGVEAMDYCPLLCFKNENPTGILLDLLEVVETKLNIRYELKAFAITRLDQALESGQVDVKFPDNPIWNKPSEKDYSKALIPYRDGFFTFELAKSKSIQTAAIPAGFYVPRSVRKEIKVTHTTSIDAMFKLLEHNRVDAIYLNHLVARMQAKSRGVIIIERTDYPADVNHYHFSTIKNEEFLRKVDHLLTTEPKIISTLLANYDMN